MNKLRLQLQAAGFANYSPWQAVTLAIAAATLLASWVQLSFGVFGLTASAFLATIGILIEFLNIKAKQRSDALTKLWPELIESLQSAATSGIGQIDALNEIAKDGPEIVRAEFAQLIQLIDSGSSLDEALGWLKAQLGQIHSDRLIELIRLTALAGGTGYIESLKLQAQSTRSEISIWGELESKQGWVTGTAKLAIVAPWLIVAFLSSRPENVNIYNSSEGLTVLVFGLIVSLIAYRLVAMLGYLSKPQRIFTK